MLFKRFADIDSIDLEMAKMMKSSGCGVVSFGVETGSDRLLRDIKKGNDVKVAYRPVHAKTLTNDVQYFPPKERVY